MVSVCPSRIPILLCFELDQIWDHFYYTNGPYFYLRRQLRRYRSRQFRIIFFFFFFLTKFKAQSIWMCGPVGLFQKWSESRIMIHEPRIMNHESRIMNHESRIMNHKSRIMNHESRIMNNKSWFKNHDSWLLYRIEESWVMNHDSWLI